MSASKKVTFSELPFVSARAYPLVAQGAADEFVSQWNRAEFDVRKFRRAIRAGGTSLPMCAIVVRRKQPEPLRTDGALQLDGLTGAADPRQSGFSR